MSRIIWDETDSRYFSTGLDRGVLYLNDGVGVPWNGLISVNEAPSGSDSISNYYDGSKFFANRSPEEFGGTISAYTYPSEFDKYIGNVDGLTTQDRKTFAFSYRTLLASNPDELYDRYRIHIVYNAVLKPSNRNFNSATSTVSASPFSWSFNTSSMKIDKRVGSHIVIDTGMISPIVLKNLEDILYGTEESTPSFPDPQAIIDIFEDAAVLKIIDHGDGTWTADGPDEAIIMLSETMFEITWPSAIHLNPTTYEISSL